MEELDHLFDLTVACPRNAIDISLDAFFALNHTSRQPGEVLGVLDEFEISEGVTALGIVRVAVSWYTGHFLSVLLEEETEN